MVRGVQSIKWEEGTERNECGCRPKTLAESRAGHQALSRKENCTCADQKEQVCPPTGRPVLISGCAPPHFATLKLPCSLDLP